MQEKKKERRGITEKWPRQRSRVSLIRRGAEEDILVNVGREIKWIGEPGRGYTYATKRRSKIGGWQRGGEGRKTRSVQGSRSERIGSQRGQAGSGLVRCGGRWPILPRKHSSALSIITIRDVQELKIGGAGLKEGGKSRSL